MVKAGMDTDSPGNVSSSNRMTNVSSKILGCPKHGGYDADPTYNAYGFSQLHDSGTGGVRNIVRDGVSAHFTHYYRSL
jgi:hypothetical protein